MEQQRKRAKHANKSQDTKQKETIITNTSEFWIHIYRNQQTIS